MDSKFIDANFVPYTPNRWLSYDDVSLLPKGSDISSRKDSSISTSTKLTSGIDMATPIISANMDTVTESEMALCMHRMGGVGILHRFYESKEQWKQDIKLVYDTAGYVAYSIGLSPSDIDLIEENLKEGIARQIVCIDVAHGHMEMVHHQIRKIVLNFPKENVQVIAGNISTPAGAQFLVSAGVHGIKVGQSCGSFCTTRLVTGHGVPQLSAIMNVRRALYSMQSNVALIADGGIRDSGDIVKALAAGADSVMVGRLFASTSESPGNLYYKDGNNYVQCETETDYSYKEYSFYKKYRGQSSADFMEDINKQGVAPEGVSQMIPYKGSVEPIFHRLLMGLRSGMTYSGIRNLKELYNKSQFIEISHAGYIEGTPYGIN